MTANKDSIGSDWAKVDAYVNTAADYDEIPEATAEDFARGVIEVNGAPMPRDAQTVAEQELVTLHLDAEVIDAFRAAGPEWRDRINAALRNSLKRDVSEKA